MLISNFSIIVRTLPHSIARKVQAMFLPRSCSHVILPPIGAAKQQPTPTAQAADNISVFRSSFCPIRIRYTHTYNHKAIQRGAQCEYMQWPKNKCVSHEKTKVTSCVQMFHCEAAAVSLQLMRLHM